MTLTSKLIALTSTLALAGTIAQGAVVISQYVETNSGTAPKGIEIWNSGATDIDFSVTDLTVYQGVNGGALGILTGATLSSGTLSAGDVWVIGTTDIGTYLDSTFGVGNKNFTDYGFSFNGDDSLQIQLDSVVQDTMGIPGSDPGSAWTGSGVSTANQNIQLIDDSFATGDLDGWTDPSTRFVTVSTTPVDTGGLAGFGLAPVPEPATYAALLGLFGLGLVMIRRRR